MQVCPEHVAEHGSTAAIVLSVLVEASQGSPIAISRTALGRAAGLRRVAVGRALDRLTRGGAIRVDRIRRLNKLVIHVLAVAADRYDVDEVARDSPTMGRSRVGARLDSLRALLDAVG
jgi:hypothetical protein